MQQIKINICFIVSIVISVILSTEVRRFGCQVRGSLRKMETWWRHPFSWGLCLLTQGWQSLGWACVQEREHRCMNIMIGVKTNHGVIGNNCFGLCMRGRKRRGYQGFPQTAPLIKRVIGIRKWARDVCTMLIKRRRGCTCKEICQVSK